MTGDGKAIGAKFGIAFKGKWVWGMKDYIDRSFMKLFDPNYLFNDYQTKGYAEPLENNELFDSEKSDERSATDHIRIEVNGLNSRQSAEWLAKHEEHEDFYHQLFVLDRMGGDEAFCKDVVSHYNQLKRYSSS